LTVTFKDEEFHLSRSPHNKLQKYILDDFVPRFVPGSKLIYLGDTKKRELKKDDEILSNFNIKVLENYMMQDIILFDETKEHK